MELPIVKTPMHVTYMYAASEWLMEDRISLRSDFSLLLLDDDAQLLCVRHEIKPLTKALQQPLLPPKAALRTAAPPPPSSACRHAGTPGLRQLRARGAARRARHPPRGRREESPAHLPDHNPSRPRGADPTVILLRGSRGPRSIIKTLSPAPGRPRARRSAPLPTDRPAGCLTARAQRQPPPGRGSPAAHTRQHSGDYSEDNAHARRRTACVEGRCRACPQRDAGAWRAVCALSLPGPIWRMKTAPIWCR